MDDFTAVCCCERAGKLNQKMADSDKQETNENQGTQEEESDDEFVGPMPVESGSPKAKKRKGKCVNVLLFNCLLTSF